MNILYISNLSTNIAAGLNWSVPATVYAQSKIDNVFWLNLSNVEMKHWLSTNVFHNLNEFGDKLTLSSLPDPFNYPDIVVFEGFYHPRDPKLAKELRKKQIPYIIVPRSALTKQAQNSSFTKKIKKYIANKLIFRPYTKRALAIQYLTKCEREDSGSIWNECSFIVPNGFNTPKLKKTSFSSNGIKIVFIGRLDCYQKGLDELLKACKIGKEFFINNHIQFDLYGPSRYDYEKIREFIVDNNLNIFVRLHPEITGAEKEQILLISDLFIMPSRFEGHPMGLIEALNYGLPALVTKGTNMCDEVTLFDAGWCCEVNAESIVHSIKCIYNDKRSLSSKGNNARYLGELYDWDKIAIKFHKEVKSLLELI